MIEYFHCIEANRAKRRFIKELNRKFRFFKGENAESLTAGRKDVISARFEHSSADHAARACDLNAHSGIHCYMETKELKKLVEKYSPEKLESCILQQLSKGENECNVVDGADEVVTVLSKAEVVREMMDQGMSFSEALRELARRIRSVYGKEE